MHRDHPGTVRSERGTQAVRASAEEAARELEERRKNAVDKKFMYEQEEKKKLEKSSMHDAINQLQWVVFMDQLCRKGSK